MGTVLQEKELIFQLVANFSESLECGYVHFGFAVVEGLRQFTNTMSDFTYGIKKLAALKLIDGIYDLCRGFNCVGDANRIVNR